MRIKRNLHSPLWAKLTFLGVIAIYLFWLIPNSARLFLSDIYSLSPKNSINTYGSKGDFNLTKWLQTKEQLNHALTISPDDPNLLFSMGQLNAMRGYMSKGNKLISKAYYDEAIKYYEQSLKVRPRDALTWVNFLIALDAINSESIKFNYTLQQAQVLSKNEKYLADIVDQIETKHQAVVKNELKKNH